MDASRIAADRGACGRATAGFMAEGPFFRDSVRRDFPALSLSRPAGTERQSPVVGPDGDLQPPGACLRGTRAGHRILLRYQDAS